MVVRLGPSPRDPRRATSNVVSSPRCHLPPALSFLAISSYNRLTMSYAARFEFGLFNGPADPADAFLSFQAVVYACDLLYRHNINLLIAYPKKIPRLYESGIFYKTPENACGGDVWQDILVMLPQPPFNGRGFGDCKDLACYRAAELTVRDGIRAVPIVKRKWLERGFGLYHVLVGFPDGTTEDPSILLGMNPSEAA